MTDFITRTYANKYFEIIIQTDSKEHYKATEDFAIKLIDHAKPMTNADRIRAMSDEELAGFLCGTSTAECCDRSCPARHICGYADNGMIKWLQQPVKENDYA